MPALPIDAILETSPCSAATGIRIGASREGRDIFGYQVGGGRRGVSLIAGCHADEPVGPAMLDRLAAFLLSLPATAPLVTRFTWYLVPHTNPDGETRNARWIRPIFGDHGRLISAGADPGLYLRHTVREPPGDDVEFGFPRVGNHAPLRGGLDARPENAEESAAPSRVF